MIDRVTNKKHILLVDDEKPLTQMLAMLLETRGYDVDVANSGREALQKVSPHLDLIILDLILQDFNGFEICRRLKEDEWTNHIPIIILSAHSLHADKVEGLYLGADDFLAKPCEYEELFARMEAVMRRGNGKAPTNEQRQQDSIILELRKILDEALVTPYFQPIYVFDPLRLLGVELLTRPRTTGLLASPETFFKQAVRFGMYPELELLSWSKALPLVGPFLKTEKIFLNCNPYFIESIDFERVLKIFESNHIPPKNVVLEITERSAIADFDLFYQKLQIYRKHGFSFAVDDVGGGYASLESIAETRPEVIKIDRNITRNLSHDPYKRSIIKFVVSFCKENGIIPVAEGIENKDDLQLVRDLGVTGGQGYYLFRPTVEVDFQAFWTKIPPM
ncbi:MAG: EAL domain-containing protein [Candidatus Omnitrophota bacterium]|nr:EAL domain-containing protein [Candidatus Omnitrophota bacterium]MDZ4243459.1 EAL domain-containing protein [Candidatus Omnitrophota bacterium]